MKHFSGKDKKQLNSQFPKGYKIDKKDELVEYSGVLFKNKEHFLIQLKENDSKEYSYIPHLKSLNSDSILNFKLITIDVGAVPFLLKGADMMRPGITQIDSKEGFDRGDLTIIVDEVKNLKIGIGRALFSSLEMEKMSTGKVVKTLHYFKDSYYGITL